MDLQIENHVKRKKIIDDKHCVLCEKSLDKESSKNPVVKNASKEGLQSLLDAAEIRKDQVYDLLWPVKDDILSLKVKVLFHKNCRANYTSKHNLQCIKRKQEILHSSPQKHEESYLAPRRLSRASTSDFNIREQCFICGKGEKKDNKLTQVSTGTGEATRSKVLSAAEERLDDEVKLRMLSYPDLFAFDAKYHRTCYSHYISDRNIKAARKKVESELEFTSYDTALNILTKELKGSIFSSRKTVLSLKDLNARFIEILGSSGASETNYASWKLKQKLKAFYGERLSFIQRPGLTDLVCSSSVTVGDALKKASELQSELEESDRPMIEDESVNFVQDNENLILHRAAGILRERMRTIETKRDEYVGSDGIKVEECRKFVPDTLYDFISWCTSTKDYENVVSSSDNDDNSKGPNLKVLSICHGIISLGRNIDTPMQLGLANQVFHEFGSKKLVELLSSLGHTVAYDEVRTFITSIASDQLSKTDDVYVPHGIRPIDVNDTCTFVDAAIDNFDLNEDSLDGKRTTHAMASVIYQRCGGSGGCESFPRTGKKSLSVAEYNEEQLKRYNKPQKRPEPAAISDVSVVTGEDKENFSSFAAKIKDLLWSLSRGQNRENRSIPSWAGFNSLISVNEIPLTTVRYFPFLHAPPSDLSTIYTTLITLVKVAEKLGQSHILVTADLAIYSKAQQILWEKPPLLDGKVTMRLGGMHLTMAFIAAIGKLFGDGGLWGLLTGTGVYAEATARQMLQGKQYDRGIRGIQLVTEALLHLRNKSAEKWAADNGHPWLSVNSEQSMQDLKYAVKSNDSEILLNICKELEDDLIAVHETLQKFRSAGRCQSSTFTFWDSFIEAGELLLRLLRAERDADFELHLNAAAETIPYFILAGRNKYSKYTPIYVSEMRQLKENQPDMYKHMEAGAFVVKRSGKVKYNSVSTDQALEQTINLEAKSKGGVVGFTLRKSALVRWLLTRHITAEYVVAFKSMLSSKEEEARRHTDFGRSKIERDHSDVAKILDGVLNQYENPFDLNSVPGGLINITTGKVATKEIEASLTQIPGKGLSILEDFLTERLVEEKKELSFWDPQKKTATLTFANMKKALSFDKQKKLLLDPEVLFRRLFAISQQREVDLRTVLEYELAAVPPSLFNADGSMRKTVKSDLAKCLESNCAEVRQLASPDGNLFNTVYIIDGMAMVQSLDDTKFKTFDDLGDIILGRLLRILNDDTLCVSDVALVFDRYDKENSIKSMERKRRGGGEIVSSHIISGNRAVPNYKQFLKSTGNKASIAVFICYYVEQNGPCRLTNGKSIILSGGYADGEVTKQVTRHGIACLNHLFSTHEEADTRMILHAADLCQESERLIVRADDTDVLVILLFYHAKGYLSPEVYMHAGHAGKIVTRERYIPVHTIADKIGEQFCLCLPAMHALTGCDSTSSIFKIGKRTAYKTLVKNTDKLTALSNFDDMSAADATEIARTFLLLMYGKKKAKGCKTLDELRYKLSAQTDISANLLPPTEDSFHQHVLRCVYQAKVWCNSHIAKPQLPDPEGHGWYKTQDGSLELTLSMKEAAPASLRDITHLYCSDEECSVPANCQCLLAGLTCIEACSCSDCPNVKDDYDNQESDEES